MKVGPLIITRSERHAKVSEVGGTGAFPTLTFGQGKAKRVKNTMTAVPVEAERGRRCGAIRKVKVKKPPMGKQVGKGKPKETERYLRAAPS